MRFACVHVEDFLVAAQVRAEPALAERPVAVVAGAAPASRVAEANRIARAQAVGRGLTETEARARCPGLVTRPVSEERAASARAALLDAVLGVSPRLEDAGPGIVSVDIAGLGRLFGDDAAIGQRLRAAARRVGLDATVGIADSRTTASLLTWGPRRPPNPHTLGAGPGDPGRPSTTRVGVISPGRDLAASQCPRVVVVEPGQDRTALAPLPIDVLALDRSLAERFTQWGVRTLGDLAALPRDGVALRLGAAGLAAHDRALGVDREPFRPWTPPPFWEEAEAVDWEIATWDGLAPLLLSVLERLVARLAAAHVAADGLSVQFTLATGGVDHRFVAFAHPLRDVKPMLALVELDVAARPPGAALTRVTVSARTVRPAPGQRGLWQRPGPAGRDLATTLARLASLVGPDHVGSPRVLDSHHPDAVAVVPFAPPPGDGDPAPDRPETGDLAGPLAFRRLRPPRPVKVETAGDEPVRVTVGTAPEPIVARVGPWRASGEWWDVRVWARDEWDVALGDGMICRLVHELLTDRWYLDGAYD